MKTSHSLVAFAAVLLVGLCLGANFSGPANAQAPTVTVPVPRYQISAWAYAGNPSSPTPRHGYYVLDTVTGAIWTSDTNDKPLGVSIKLP
jgi:hypothetical protein